MRHHRALSGLAYALNAHCYTTEMGHDLPTLRQQPPSPAGPPASPSKAKPRWDGSEQPDRDADRVAEERRLATPKADKPPAYF